MIFPVLTAVIALLALGSVLGLLLAFASTKLYVPGNPKVELLEKALPGLNCGACGYPGCPGYAEALNAGAPIDLCKPGGHDTAQKIAVILGVEHTQDKTRRVAFVFCNGGKRAVNRSRYAGELTCKAAVLVSGGGHKQCSFGCLGFGDCVTVCQFDALHMTENATPVVDQVKCTNCGACYKACPKNIIQETIHKPMQNVVCCSHDKGSVAKAACAVSCIACGICVKNCPFQAITLENFLAVINPEKCTNCGICTTKCPTKAIS